MKTYIILLSVLVLLPSAIHAQQKETDQWSAVMKSKIDPVIFAEDDSCIYLAKTRPRRFQNVPDSYKCWIIRMHRDFTHAVESPLKMPKHFLLQFYCALGKDVLFFSTLSDTAHRETVLYAQVLNKKTLSLGPPVRVLRLEGTYRSADFRPQFSPDKNKYLIYAATNKRADFGYKSQSTPDRLSYWIVDKQLNVISTNTSPVNFLKPGEVFTDPQLAIDNNETVYVLGRVFGSAQEWLDRRDQVLPRNNSVRHGSYGPITYFAHTKYYVCIYPRGDKPEIHPIDIGEFVKGIKLVVGKKQEIYLVGSYATDFRSRSTGCIVLKIKPHSDVLAFKTLYPYWDLITRGQSKEENANTTYTVPYVAASAMADGGLIVTLEVRTHGVTLYFLQPVTEVAMIRVSPDGKITNDGVAFKQYYNRGKPAGGIFGVSPSRISRQAEYSYIRELRYKDDIVYVYNQLQNDALMMTTIASDGTINTRSLVANNEFKPLPLLTTYDSGGLIFTRRHGNDFQLRRIAVN